MTTLIRDDDLDILARVSRARSFVHDWGDNMDRWRRLYDMSHYPNTKAYKDFYNDPTYTNTVDLATGIILGNKLKWHVTGPANSTGETRDTTKVEKLLAALFYINDEREEVVSVFEVIMNFVRDGGGCLYGGYDPKIAQRSKRVEEKPSEENPDQTESIVVYEELPLVMKVIDPRSLILYPGGPKRWLVMGRREGMTVLDAESKFAVKLKRYAHIDKEEKLRTMVTVTDMWDYVHDNVPVINEDKIPELNADGTPKTKKEWRVRNTILVDNEIVLEPRFMDGYDDLPFTVQFFKPTSKESKSWQGIISVLETSIKGLEKSVNRRSRQIDIYSSLPLVTNAQHGRPIKIGAGLYEHVALGPDEKIGFPSWPGNAPDVEQHMDFLRSRIQQSGFSDVMFGSGASQITGYALSQLGDQNRIRLTQPIEHLQLMFSHFARKALSLLQTFCTKGSQLKVYGQMRGVDFVDMIDIADIKDFMVRAEIVPEYPNEETRKVAMSTQAKGQLSQQTIMEKYLGIDRPDDEFQRMTQDAVRNSPEMLQFLINTEMIKMAEGGDLAAAMVLAQQAQGQGAEGQEGGQEQLTGTQGPDGLGPNQSSGGQAPGESAIEKQEGAAAQSPNLDGGI